MLPDIRFIRSDEDVMETTSRLLRKLVIRCRAKTIAVADALILFAASFQFPSYSADIDKMVVSCDDETLLRDGLQHFLSKSPKGEKDYEILWLLQSKLPDFANIEAVVQELIAGIGSSRLKHIRLEVLRKLVVGITLTEVCRVASTVLVAFSEISVFSVHEELTEVLKLLVDSHLTDDFSEGSLNLGPQALFCTGCFRDDRNIRQGSLAMLRHYSTHLPGPATLRPNPLSRGCQRPLCRDRLACHRTSRVPRSRRCNFCQRQVCCIVPLRTRSSQRASCCYQSDGGLGRS